MEPEDDVRHRIELRAVPIQQFVKLQGYFDDMVREMQLIAVGRADHGATERLADLAVYVQHDISHPRNLLHAEAIKAQRRGQAVADLAIDLLPASLPDAHRLLEVTEALDAQSRAGLLLTNPASDEVLDLLRWIIREVENQLGAGRAPEPYQP